MGDRAPPAPAGPDSLARPRGSASTRMPIGGLNTAQSNARALTGSLVNHAKLVRAKASGSATSRGWGDDSEADALLSRKKEQKLLRKLVEDIEGLKKKDAELEENQAEFAEIEEDMDEVCETLATFISMTALSPTFSTGHTVASLILTLFIWILQTVLTFKLYNNAVINDGGQAMLDIGSGYLEMNFTMENITCPEDEWEKHGGVNGSAPPEVHCSEMVKCVNDTLPAGTMCRYEMMDAFEEAIFTRKAAECAGCEFAEDRQMTTEYSSSIPDMYNFPEAGGVNLCFTERGLANGWVNLAFGMLIIVITLIREILESIGGIYVVRKLKQIDLLTGRHKVSRKAVASYVWVVLIVAFHNVIGIYLLYASFRRMINAPNDIWAVVESSISAFLVVSIDEAVLYCLLQHPITIAALDPLGMRPMRPDAIDLAREEEAQRLGEVSTESIRDKRVEKELIVNIVKEGDEPQWEETGCHLWQPTSAIMKSGGSLILFNYMVEWACGHFFFWFTGGRLSKFTALACADAKAKNDDWQYVSDLMSKGGPYSIVLLGMALDFVSICRGHEIETRCFRLTRFGIFYIGALMLVESCSLPEWLFDEPRHDGRFWSTSPAMWTARGVACLLIFIATPGLKFRWWKRTFIGGELTDAELEELAGVEGAGGVGMDDEESGRYEKGALLATAAEEKEPPAA